MSEQGCISLAEALEILGPVRAWASTKDGEPVFWLDGAISSERAIKREAHCVWRERNTRHT